MMFGHVETVEDRIEHLERVRAQQDKSRAGVPPGQATQWAEPSQRASNDPAELTAVAGGTPTSLVAGETPAPRLAGETPALQGGFTAFIAWTFQAENTKLKAPTVGAHEYLRMQALSRIYLDNIPNTQSSWVTQGQDIGQVALKFGANDLGSIMIEENVVSQAGTTFRMTVADMQRLISDLGYEPRQRDNWYRLVG